MSVMEVLTRLVVGTGKVGDYLLSRKASGLLVASLAFACGAFVVHATKPAPRARYVATPTPPVFTAQPCETAEPPAPVVAATTDEEEEAEYGTPELQEWKNRNSGAALPVGYDFSPRWAEFSKVSILPSGRTLAAAGNTLYMLDGKRRVRWKYEMPQSVVDFAHVEKTGVVCGTAYDNHMFILDAATGRVLFSDSRNGRAGFGAVLKYGDDVCLIAEELGGYNVDYRGHGDPGSNGVMAWRGSKMIWATDAPPDAELQVVGSKIYAVTKTKDRILVKELKMKDRVIINQDMPPKGGR